MTPKWHRIVSIVTGVGGFVGVMGVGVPWVGLRDGFWFLLPLAVGMLTLMANFAVWFHLIRARCPDCGTRCRLDDEPDGMNSDGSSRSVTRYHCPQCRHKS